MITNITILTKNCRNAIPEPGSENHEAFMETRMMEATERQPKRTSTNSPKKDPPKEEL